MQRVSTTFYRRGYSVADYYNKYGKGDDLSLFIEVMKDIPTSEYKDFINSLIRGWVSWLKKEILELDLKFDLVIRALGHNELDYSHEKPMSYLAKELAKEIGAEYCTDLIRKTRVTNSQTTLKYDFNTWRRSKNVAGSIVSNVNCDFLKDKAILVLDDIKTTGSTLQSIALALYCHGKSQLYFITLGQSTSSPTPTNSKLLSHLKASVGLG